MSDCHQPFRRLAYIGFFLALFSVSLTTLASAQADDTVPKVEWFIGYQWLNPGGNVPDQNTPPNAFKAPSLDKGLGTNVSYNFTRNLSLEGNYGGNWSTNFLI